MSLNCSGGILDSVKRTTAIAFSLSAFCALLFSYNPPTDTVGPITVQIETPAAGAYGSGGLLRFTQPDVPFSVPVWIQNRGAALVTGTLRLAVIDRWRADPSGPVPFSIGPGSRKQIEFTVSFPKGTFSLLWPKPQSAGAGLVRFGQWLEPHG